jgi:hypothetical protein
MLALNPRFGQFAGKHTHFVGHEQALLSGHGPVDPELDRLRGQACVGEGHEQNAITETASTQLAAGDSANDDQGLLAGGDGIWQRSVGRFVRKIFFAGKEPQEGPALLRGLVADGAAQHGVTGFEGVENGALGYGGADFDFHLSADVGERSQMLREDYANHISILFFFFFSSHSQLRS